MYYCNWYYKEKIIEHATSVESEKKYFNFISYDNNKQLFKEGTISNWYTSYLKKKISSQFETPLSDISNATSKLILSIIDNNYNFYEVIAVDNSNNTATSTDIGFLYDLNYININIPSTKSNIIYYLMIETSIVYSTYYYITEIKTNCNLTDLFNNYNYSDVDIRTNYINKYNNNKKLSTYNNIHNNSQYSINITNILFDGNTEYKWYTNNSVLVNNSNIFKFNNNIYNKTSDNIYFIFSIIDNYFVYYNINLIEYNKKKKFILNNINILIDLVKKIYHDTRNYYFYIQKIYLNNNNFEFINIFIQLLPSSAESNIIIDLTKCNFNKDISNTYNPINNNYNNLNPLDISTPSVPSVTTPAVPSVTTTAVPSVTTKVAASSTTTETTPPTYDDSSNNDFITNLFIIFVFGVIIFFAYKMSNKNKYSSD